MDKTETNTYTIPRINVMQPSWPKGRAFERYSNCHSAFRKHVTVTNIEVRTSGDDYKTLEPQAPPCNCSHTCILCFQDILSICTIMKQFPKPPLSQRSWSSCNKLLEGARQRTDVRLRMEINLSFEHHAAAAQVGGHVEVGPDSESVPTLSGPVVSAWSSVL